MILIGFTQMQNINWNHLLHRSNVLMLFFKKKENNKNNKLSQIHVAL